LSSPASPLPSLAPPSGNRQILRPAVGWQPVNLAELWRYRELLWILALRDVKVRYKQTVLGVAWAVIQPLATMVAFTAIGSMGNLSTEGFPRPLFQYAALLPWFLFANAFASAGASLIGNQNLISKVYFPRLVIPIAAVVTGLIDFAVSFGVLVLLMSWYRQVPPPQVVLLPAFVAMAFFAALAAGLWAAALSVEFRDVRYVIPFVIQFGLLITPILFSSTEVTTPWKRIAIGINPMTGVVDGFRWCLLGRPTPGPMLAVSAASIAVLLVGGLFYFRRMEKSFADLV
jgi:lipopolysaccharide transport system permease protein